MANVDKAKDVKKNVDIKEKETASDDAVKEDKTGYCHLIQNSSIEIYNLKFQNENS